MFYKLCAFLSAILIFQPFGSVAMAADAPTVASQAARDCAARYNRAMHMDEVMAGMMRGLMPPMIDQMEQGSGKKLSAKEKAEMVEAMAESAAVMTPKLQDMLTPTMVQVFTEPELCALAAFYESPEGQGVVAKMPGYSQAAGIAVRDFLPLFEADMMARMCKRLGCDAAKLPALSPS